MTIRWLAALALFVPLSCMADTSCPFGTPVPRDWQHAYTRAMAFRVPAVVTAHGQESFDTTVDRVEVAGVSLWIESGILAMFADEREATPGNRWPRKVTEPAHGKRGTIVATLPTDDDGMGVRVTAAFNDEAGRLVACRIIESARPLERVGELTLVGIFSTGERPCAVLRGVAAQRRVCIGDYVTRDFGRIDKVDADSVEIQEILRNRKGGWKERRTRLALAPR